jgi:hypothetical protein
VIPRTPDDDWKPVLNFVSRHGDGLWKLAQVCFFVALYLAKSEFVSRETYEADRKADREVKEALSVKITDLTTELRILRERRTDDAAQNERLADHETRIRSLERR